ncbi:hypothetical protein [Cohaesibacter haloalkalitolerans]|uniref:hypothetical protein n=1 Tax=Cohaesibacter haloalkalitolerans TaxID=1162980 RepID=UPI000E64CFBB|nr:hypothetical protein [Cohaesibacter haloalkalitolerans]
MAGETPMVWHAHVKATSGPMMKQIVPAIAIPSLIVCGGFAIMTGYEHGVAEGLKLFFAFMGIVVALFGFSFLVMVLFVRSDGIRTLFLMNDKGIYSTADDEVARAIISLGGSVGVATADPVLVANSLANQTGRVGHVAWAQIERMVERPSRNCLVFYRGRKMVYAIYTNDDNFVDVRSFVKRHLGKARKTGEALSA